MWNEELAKLREKSTGHCVFGPSQLSRIEGCPASVQESLPVPPKPPSTYAAEGTYLHSVIEFMLRQGPTRMLAKYPSIKADKEKYSWLMDGYEFYNVLRGSCGPGTVAKFEVTGNLSNFGLPEIWGTADVVIIDYGNKEAHILDWKFGKGVLVSATNSSQLKGYAGIALGYPSMVEKINLYIAQPPREHYDKWETTYTELCEWLFNGLTNTLQQVRSDDPPYNPSVENCRWCPAKFKCKARHANANEEAQRVFDMVAVKDTLGLKDWVELYDKLVTCEQIKKEVYSYLLAQSRQGEKLPGKKWVAGRSLRKFKNEVEAATYLESLNMEDIYTKKLVSPAGAEKLNRKLKKDEQFQKLVVKPPGKPTLVDENDKREAVDFAAYDSDDIEESED